jgi:hypothetical protein
MSDLKVDKQQKINKDLAKNLKEQAHNIDWEEYIN